MNNSWWQELLRFFLQGMTLKQLIHMLIILIILVIITPTHFKEWVNLRNPEIIPPYWMYYTLLFCVSYVLNGIFRYSHNLIIERLHANKERRRRDDALRIFNMKFDTLSLEERAMIAFVIEAKNNLSVKRGDKTSISLVKKGLLCFDGRNLTKFREDKFYIPDSIYHECYIRFSGKADDLIDELIESERAKDVN